MGKTLVAYFTAEMGRTAKLAEKVASIAGADLFEIVPSEPYTKADLNYMNPLARCNREKIGKKDVPVAGAVQAFSQYDTVLIGFPMWYYGAPNAINTFCKGYDWSGKKVAAFVTSGGSGIGKTAEKLNPYLSGAKLVDARMFNDASDSELKAWIESLQK